MIINLNSQRNSNSGINKNLVINISIDYKSPKPEEMLLNQIEVRMKDIIRSKHLNTNVRQLNNRQHFLIGIILNLI